MKAIHRRRALLLGCAVAIGLAMIVVTACISQAEAVKSFVPTSVEQPWTSLNGPYEKVAYAVAVAPNSRVLFAGTWGHGVYRSFDHGESWQSLEDQPSRSIKALAVSPIAENIPFAGTYSQGLWQGRYFGGTWKQRGQLSGLTGAPDGNRSSLAIESVLIVTEDGQERVYAGTRKGVWVSGVLSDTALNDPALSDPWQLLASGFEDSDDAYSVKALAAEPSGRLFAGTLGGLYALEKGGQEWSRRKPPDQSPPAANKILSLAVVTNTAHREGRLLIGTQGAGIFALDGQDWITASNGLFDDERARTIQALIALPNGVAYAGTRDFGAFKSTDLGETWHTISEGLPFNSRSILSFAWDPISDTLYAGTYGDSVYRLPPGSTTWEPANTGLPVDLPVQRLVAIGRNGENLIAGVQVGGLYVMDRVAGEPTWSRLPWALPVGQARDIAGLVAAGTNRDIVVAAAGNGISHSADGGKTWQHLSSGEGLPVGTVHAIALAQGRDNALIIYAALEDLKLLYRSDDGGATWRSPDSDLNLGSEVLPSVGLTVGSDDKTVYLSTPSGQISVTHDAGAHWLSLTPITPTEAAPDLDWADQSGGDVFQYGGYPNVLYAMTPDGFYVSHDQGQKWQLRQRGAFSAILADPLRPYIVYAATLSSTLLTEFVPVVDSPPRQLQLGSDLWVSYDQGETWNWLGSAPASITTLALSPQQPDSIYVGTDGGGAYTYALPPYQRPFALGGIVVAVTAALIVAALVGSTALVVNDGLRLARPNRLPLRTWPQLTWLRLRHGEEVALITAARSALSPLERLILALMPGQTFQAEGVRETLESAGAPTTLAQIELALNDLLDRRLLQRAEDSYRVLYPLLSRIARARFGTGSERNSLIAQVRSESDARADARRFFQRVGFDASTFALGLQVVSNRPDYALIGGERGIYAHIHTARSVDVDDVRQVEAGAGRAYANALAGKVAFLVAGGSLQPDAYLRITQLRRESDFHVVPIAHDAIRRAQDENAANRLLNHRLRRALGRTDPFQLDGPAADPLDFFGRQSEVNQISEACAAGQFIGLIGMLGVGKTSLARQVAARLSRMPIAWIDLAHRPADLYATIRQAWLIDATAKFDEWERPAFEALPEQPLTKQITADVTAIRASLAGHSSQAQLVVVMDGLNEATAESKEMQTLMQAMKEAQIGLISIFDRPLRQVQPFVLRSVMPLEPTESAELISIIAVQAELDFDADAIALLHRASGGHPRLLRQIAGRTACQGRGDSSHHADEVEVALDEYVSDANSTLGELWKSLSDEERMALRSASIAQPMDIEGTARALADRGWLAKIDGRWQVFSSALDRWLKKHHPLQA